MPKLHIFKDQPVVISVGGSMIVGSDGPNTKFIQALRGFVKREVKKGRRLVIVVGGGKTARRYIEAAKRMTKLTADDLDWLGIHATRLNAHLVRTVLRDVAHPVVVKDPTRISLRWKGRVLVAGGWKPGWSTDYVASRIAKRLGSSNIVNISNIDFVYDGDPNVAKNAKPMQDVSWSAYRKLVGDVWDPGISAPFDPVASKFCQKNGISVAVLGADFANIGRLMNGKSFKGSVLHNVTSIFKRP